MFFLLYLQVANSSIRYGEGVTREVGMVSLVSLIAITHQYCVFTVCPLFKLYLIVLFSNMTLLWLPETLICKERQTD